MCGHLDVIPMPVRSAAILTGSYVAGTVLDVHLKNQLNILVQLTIGSLTSANIKVEGSMDGTTYYRVCFDSISGGTDSVSAGIFDMTTSGNFSINMPILYRFIKISAIGVGDVTGSSMTIDAAIGVV